VSEEEGDQAAGQQKVDGHQDLEPADQEHQLAQGTELVNRMPLSATSGISTNMIACRPISAWD